MPYNLNDYEPVDQRLAKFWADHTEGRVHTELVYDDGQRCIVKASIYFDRQDHTPVAVDYAEEILTDRGVNATSRIENCCTSAIGRALADCGYASKTGERPSREEMEKVQRRAGDARPQFEREFVPATDPQRKLLNDQAVRTGYELPDLDTVSKFDASKLIDKLKTLPTRQD